MVSESANFGVPSTGGPPKTHPSRQLRHGEWTIRSTIAAFGAVGTSCECDGSEILEWRGMYKENSMCPAGYCKADDPVQALIGERQAETIGLPDLALGIHCGACGTVWINEDGHKRILGRFTGSINLAAWTPAQN